MINLLPSDYGASLRLAHFNAVIRRWIIAILIATAGLIFVIASGYLYISKQSGALNKNIALSQQQLQAQNLSQIQKDAASINNNVKLIQRVLSQEIRFSDLIQEIGKVMPDGTVLGGLSLSDTTGAIDLTAAGRDHTSLAQIAVNISDPKNDIFNKVDIVTITCNSRNSKYPCTGTYRALFSSTTKSRFLNIPKATQP